MLSKEEPIEPFLITFSGTLTTAAVSSGGALNKLNLIIIITALVILWPSSASSSSDYKYLRNKAQVLPIHSSSTSSTSTLLVIITPQVGSEYSELVDSIIVSSPLLLPWSFAADF